MKKTIELSMLIMIALCIIMLASCKKEDTTCNCGLIQSENVNDYSIVIQNECTGNNKTFYLQQGDWMNAYVGTNHCISNIDNW